MRVHYRDLKHMKFTTRSLIFDWSTSSQILCITSYCKFTQVGKKHPLFLKSLQNFFIRQILQQTPARLTVYLIQTFLTIIASPISSFRKCFKDQSLTGRGLTLTKKTHPHQNKNTLSHTTLSLKPPQKELLRENRRKTEYLVTTIKVLICITEVNRTTCFFEPIS